MYIDVNNFEKETMSPMGVEYLFVSCKEQQIVPPISVLKSNKSLIKDYDFSQVDMMNYKTLKDLTFTNVFIKALPNNIYLLDELEYVKVSFSLDADINKEVSKLSKLRNLKELDISFSLIDENDFLQIQNKLPKAEIIC